MPTQPITNEHIGIPTKNKPKSYWYKKDRQPEPLSIKMEVQRLKIKNLLHFTKIENLPNILQRGLFPRADLDAQGISYKYNDEKRLDFCGNASCLSISFPNYKMFFKYRNIDKNQKWIVISLSPNLLWEKECAFCYSNAADSEITAIPLEDRKNPEAFLEMFRDFQHYPKRSVLNLKDHYPTNPQAEVLVFDLIEPNYFQCCFFNDQYLMRSYQNNIFYKYEENMFSPRVDYGYWK